MARMMRRSDERYFIAINAPSISNESTVFIVTSECVSLFDDVVRAGWTQHFLNGRILSPLLWCWMGFQLFLPSGVMWMSPMRRGFLIPNVDKPLKCCAILPGFDSRVKFMPRRKIASP